MRILTLTAAVAFLPLTAFPLDLSGTLRMWGDSYMQTVVSAWQKGFQKHYPDVMFETKLAGTGTGMAGLYTGVADLAFMGRAATPKEIMAFEWVHKYKPLGIEILTGSLDAPGKSPALVVFVHKDNPLARLTLDQLAAVFGCEHRRGSGPVQSWGALGLTGEWAEQPIHIYMPDAETGTASFFGWKVLGANPKWNWARTEEFKDESGKRILDALASDRYGIGFSNLRASNTRVKPVALAARSGVAYFEATPANLIKREYPLARTVSVYINRPREQAIEPRVKEFLRYVLSREGQQAAAQDGDFLPLNPDAIREQLKKLE
jgi:phosphate transport system substrate-binding protein